METKDKKPRKSSKKIEKPIQEEQKKMSKTWEAVLKLQGTGKILDMRAVLK